jgi:hypothetical protein
MKIYQKIYDIFNMDDSNNYYEFLISFCSYKNSTKNISFIFNDSFIFFTFIDKLNFMNDLLKRYCKNNKYIDNKIGNWETYCGITTPIDESNININVIKSMNDFVNNIGIAYFTRSENFNDRVEMFKNYINSSMSEIYEKITKYDIKKSFDYFINNPITLIIAIHRYKKDLISKGFIGSLETPLKDLCYTIGDNMINGILNIGKTLMINY